MVFSLLCSMIESNFSCSYKPSPYILFRTVTASLKDVEMAARELLVWTALFAGYVSPCEMLLHDQGEPKWFKNLQCFTLIGKLPRCGSDEKA